MSLAGISTAVLPTLVDSDACVGAVRGGDSHRGGGLAGVPVVAGAADTAAALFALRSGWESAPASASWSDVRVLNAGTGIQVVRPGAAAGPRADPHTHLYADADGGWYDMLAIQNGGLARVVGAGGTRSVLGHVRRYCGCRRSGIPRRGLSTLPDA